MVGRFLRVLTGPAGFVATPDARTLHIAARPAPDDPAGFGLAAGAAFGMLGIDLATRRRNRANGRIISSGPDGITIAVTQSFGNCPQYIQSRDLRYVSAAPAPAQRLAGLDAAARRMIAQADTFFAASSSGPADDKRAGMDISHRGGRPGFVRMDGDVLTVPDFAGNRYYNTLGNFLIYPKAGLLFIDFESGDMLHLAGETEIVWRMPEEERLEGAERLWRFRVVWGCRRQGALPFRWDFRSLSRGAARTGTWA